MPRKLLLLICAAIPVLTLAMAQPSGALAAGQMNQFSGGTDISWPQCGQDYPGGATFAILGVTGGTPFTSNDCLGDEYAWAQHYGLNPQLYVNLEFGQSATGPLSCLDGDPGCQAYNFGWLAAQDAFARGSSMTNGASRQIATWWLDVETENVWADDTGLNSYVIQGAIDYLQRMQGKVVGIYSTSYQWGEIAGSYAPPGIPNWVAGADDLLDKSYCSASLWPGGQVWVYQWLDLDANADYDFAC